MKVRNFTKQRNQVDDALYHIATKLNYRFFTITVMGRMISVMYTPSLDAYDGYFVLFDEPLANKVNVGNVGAFTEWLTADDISFRKLITGERVVV